MHLNLWTVPASHIMAISLANHVFAENSLPFDCHAVFNAYGEQPFAKTGTCL